MSTFREAVEFQVKEAIKEVTGFPNITAGEKSLAPLLVDRIMEAYKAKVEGMFERHTHPNNTVVWTNGGYGANFTGKYHIEDSTKFIEACKSYLLKEG
jgi:hypothetical protein